jgi:hypothetical protein
MLRIELCVSTPIMQQRMTSLLSRFRSGLKDEVACEVNITYELRKSKVRE